MLYLGKGAPLEALKTKRTHVRGRIEPLERRRLFSTFVVNSAIDAISPSNSTRVTLRDAIIASNNTPDADIIQFDSAIFKPTSPHTITLTLGQLQITQESGGLTIRGPGMDVLSITSADSRVFESGEPNLPGINLELADLRITGATAIAGPDESAQGGAIRSFGNLSLERVRIDHCSAIGADGEPVFIHQGANAEGGAVYCLGQLQLTSCTIDNNLARGGTGVNNELGQGNDGGQAFGGAIWGQRGAKLQSTNILNNQAAGGSGSDAGYLSGAGGQAQGGGIYTGLDGSFIFHDGNISGNIAQGGDAIGGGITGGNAIGGGVYSNSAIEIVGSTFDRNRAVGGYKFRYGVGGNAQGGALFSQIAGSISKCTISRNEAQGGGADVDSHGGAGFGGGIFIDSNGFCSEPLQITSSSIIKNIASGRDNGADVSGSEVGAFGGGIFAFVALNIKQSTINDNAAIGGTGSIYSNAGASALGGGICGSYLISIESSTVSNNSAIGGNGNSEYWASSGYLGNGGDAQGGGIFCNDYFGQLQLKNSTVTGNSASGGNGGILASPDATEISSGNGGTATGGAIYSPNQKVEIIQSTVSNNRARGGAGGQGSSDQPAGFAGTATGGAVTNIYSDILINNSIIAGNTLVGAAQDDITGFVNDQSAYNLLGFGSGLADGTNGNIVDVADPKLGPLTNNGGPTKTLMLLPDSPAIDAGSRALVPDNRTGDQRGYWRFIRGKVDIGAIERQAPTATPAATFSGTVFNDLNKNGRRDPAENVLVKSAIYLDMNNNGVPDKGDVGVTTDANGRYTFVVAPGTYHVRKFMRPAYRLTLPTDDGYDLTLKSGDFVNDLNFGHVFTG